MTDKEPSHLAVEEEELHHERFSEMTRILFDKDRSLQDQSSTAPTPSQNYYPPTGGGGLSTPAPAPTTNNETDTSSDLERALPLIVLVVAFLVLFCCYKIYQTCRHRREQHLMRLRSVQADQVLGDMQMVPSEDPDAELL